MIHTFFIPFNTPSSKNSKVWTGRYLVNSKAVQKYIKATKAYWIDNTNDFVRATQSHEKPLRVHLYFVRDSKRKFDLVNASQIVLDLMVEYGWIPDDNADEIIPVFEGYEVNKTKAGVFIDIYDS